MMDEHCFTPIARRVIDSVTDKECEEEFQRTVEHAGQWKVYALYARAYSKYVESERERKRTQLALEELQAKVRSGSTSEIPSEKEAFRAQLQGEKWDPRLASPGTLAEFRLFFLRPELKLNGFSTPNDYLTDHFKKQEARLNPLIDAILLHQGEDSFIIPLTPLRAEQSKTEISHEEVILLSRMFKRAIHFGYDSSHFSVPEVAGEKNTDVAFLFVQPKKNFTPVKRSEVYQPKKASE